MVLNPLVSLFGRLVARSGRKRGNRQTNGRNDRPSTVTLAAHARRGLIIMMSYVSMYQSINLYALTYILQVNGKISKCNIGLAQKGS